MLCNLWALLERNHSYNMGIGMSNIDLSTDRAGDHVTFVYGNIVSQQIVFAIFFRYIFQTSIYLYRSCSRKSMQYYIPMESEFGSLEHDLYE